VWWCSVIAFCTSECTGVGVWCGFVSAGRHRDVVGKEDGICVGGRWWWRKTD